MNCKYMVSNRFQQCTLVQTRPVIARPGCSVHRKHAAAAQATAEQAPTEKQPQQQASDEQQRKSRNRHQQERIKRQARSWQDDSTPNKGLIGIKQKSVAAGAAACVAADLKEAPLTRIVAYTPNDIPKAVNVLGIATRMLNSNWQQAEQQEQQQSSAAEQVLVFQPVKIDGVLVQPNVLPQGATALYTYPLAADHPALQAAVAARDASIQAVAGNSSSGDNQSSSISVRPSADEGFVGMKATSDVRGAAGALASSVRRRGWAELTCFGGPLATRKGIEAIQSARGLLHSRDKQDVAAVFMGFWTKEVTAQAATDAQQQQRAEEEASTAQDQMLNEQDGEQIGPLPYRCATFMVIGCAKNKPTQLVMPKQQ